MGVVYSLISIYNRLRPPFLRGEIMDNFKSIGELFMQIFIKLCNGESIDVGNYDDSEKDNGD